jgi:hypothetical protein
MKEIIPSEEQSDRTADRLRLIINEFDAREHRCANRKIDPSAADGCALGESAVNYRNGQRFILSRNRSSVCDWVLAADEFRFDNFEFSRLCGIDARALICRKGAGRRKDQPSVERSGNERRKGGRTDCARGL